VLRRTAGRDREPRLDLVEDEDDAVSAGDLPDGLEVARRGQDDAEVHHRGLHDQAGRQPSLGLEPLNAALHRVGVVEGNGHGEIHERCRNAGAVGERLEILAVADRLVGNVDRDHHAVVVTVIRAEDLQDGLPPRERAGNADRVHRRFGAGIAVAPLRQPEPSRELLGHDDRVLGRGREVRSQPEPLLERARDRRVRVALDHRPEGVMEVAQLVAVDVPDPLTAAVGEVDRPRLVELIGGRDAARKRAAGARVHPRRRLRSRLEAPFFPLGELRDSGRIESCDRRHPASP
jgi:hypothetical protein